MSYPFTRATEAILRIVEESNGYTNSNRIVNKLTSELGLSATNKTRTKSVIAAMVASGVLEGRVIGLNSFIYGINENNSAVNENLVSELRTRVQTLERDEQTYRERLTELQEKLTEAENKAPQDRIVEVVIKKAGTKTVKMKDIFHAEFETLVDLVQARENIYLFGPTGSGKTFICSQVAKACKLKFYFVSCTAGMSEGVLGGRLLPTGNQGTFEYVMSEFVKAYEEGGVFLLDEVDAADANVLLLVNAALANGKMAVPNRPEKPYATRHKDFVCIAAANTVGTGGDRLYSGRNQLDAATLDRFLIGKVFIDYDRQVEAQLCPDDDLRNYLWAIREGINAHRLERAMSTRFLQKAYKMCVADDGPKWDRDKMMKAYFLGWREDEKNKVLEHMRQNAEVIN